MIPTQPHILGQLQSGNPTRKKIFLQVLDKSKYLCQDRMSELNKQPAELAELVDALDSGSSVRKDVGVRVTSSAPKKNA